MLTFVLGLLGGLLLAGVFVALLAFLVGGPISIQLPEKGQRGKRSSRGRAPAAPEPPTRRNDDLQLRAALKHWQFSRAEVDHAVSSTAEFVGPIEERVRAALAALRPPA